MVPRQRYPRRFAKAALVAECMRLGEPMSSWVQRRLWASMNAWREDSVQARWP